MKVFPKSIGSNLTVGYMLSTSDFYLFATSCSGFLNVYQNKNVLVISVYNCFNLSMFCS